MGFWASAEDPTEPGAAPGYKPTFNVAMSDPNKTPDYEKNKAAIMALYDQRKRLGGPADVVAQKAGYTAPSGVGAGYQSDAAKGLDAASAGKGPSVSGAVMGAGVDDALRARMSAAAGLRPGANQALASSAMGGAAAAAMQSAAAKAAMAKAQETTQASSQYGALLGAMRGQDLGTAAEANRINLANAGFDQSASLANQGTSLQWSAMSDAEKNALLGMSMGLDQNEMTNRLNQYQFQHGGAAAERAMRMRDQMLRDQQMGQLVMGVGQGVGYGASAYSANQPQGGWDTYREDLTRK